MNKPSINEIFVYHLLDNDKLPFEIQNNSNLVVLDGYHERENYSLRVKSKRELSIKPNLPEPSCLLFLNVSVLPANRNPPKFLQEHYIVHVREDVKILQEQSHFLIKLDAVDEDLEEFGQLTYSLITAVGSKSGNSQGSFAVEERTGALTLSKPVDHEAENQYNLVVVVTDGGGLTARTNITVNIDDVNGKTFFDYKALLRQLTEIRTASISS